LIKKVLKQAGVVHNTKPQAQYMLKQLKIVTRIPTVSKYHITKEMQIRDITILAYALPVVYMIMHYSSLFQYFFIDLLSFPTLIGNS